MKMPEKFVNAFNKVKFGAKKYSPEVLIITGVVGVVASAIMACKATTKVSEIKNKHDVDVARIHEYAERSAKEAKESTGDQTVTGYTKEDERKDLTRTYFGTAFKYAKLYAPSVILGTLSITCLVSSNTILRKRNAALAAAYATVDKSFKRYRSNVVERFGEEVDKELKYNVKAKEVTETTEEKGKEKKVKKTVKVSDPNGYSNYAKFYDDGCEGWQKDAEHNLWFLKQQQNFANEKLKANGYLFLNDVYDMLGIPRTTAGQIVGWLYNPKDPNHVGDNYVDFGIYDTNKEVNRDFVNGYERTILLDFNVDGPIYDLI